MKKYIIICISFISISNIVKASNISFIQKDFTYDDSLGENRTFILRTTPACLRFIENNLPRAGEVAEYLSNSSTFNEEPIASMSHTNIFNITSHHESSTNIYGAAFQEHKSHMRIYYGRYEGHRYLINGALKGSDGQQSSNIRDSQKIFERFTNSNTIRKAKEAKSNKRIQFDEPVCPTPILTKRKKH